MVERVAWLILMALPERVSGVLKERADSRPREEVAVRVYVPVLLPTRMFPYVGEAVMPVPPKAVESVVVALTTPLIA